MRGALILTSVLALCFMTGVDVWAEIASPGLVGGLFQSLASNIVGGPLTSCVLVVIIWLSHQIKQHLSEHIKLANFVSAILPVILGLIIALGQYYILTLLYNPIQSNIEAKTSPSSDMTYIIDKAARERLAKAKSETCECETSPPKNGVKDFDFINGSVKKGFEINGISKNSKVIWKKTDDQEFEVNVTAFDGCFKSTLLEPSTIEKAKALKKKNINSMAVSIDEGTLFLGLAAPIGNIEFSNDKVIQAWQTKDGDSQGLVRFIPTTEGIDYWTDGEAATLTLQFPLLEIQQGSIAKPKQRTVKIEINGETIPLTFVPLSLVGKLGTCSVMDLTSSAMAPTNYPSKFSAVKLVIQIRQTSKENIFNFQKHNSFNIKGLNGWLWIQGIEGKEVQKLVPTGTLEGLSIRGQIDYVRLNGAPIEDLTDHTYSFYNAKIEGSADASGSLLYRGVADSVWVDGRRLSKTRWESLDGATQGILGSAASLILLGFGVMLRLCLRENPSYRI